MIVWVFLAVCAVAMAVVRFAPADVDRLHQPIEAQDDKAFKGGVIVVRDLGADGLARFDIAARGLKRTHVLAGAVDEGLVTYVTRSQIFGFPDYTTVQQVGTTLRIFARLRFGRSDLGVNEQRVRQVLAALE